MAAPHPSGTAPHAGAEPCDNCHVRTRGERLVPALQRQRPGENVITEPLFESTRNFMN